MCSLIWPRQLVDVSSATYPRYSIDGGEDMLANAKWQSISWRTGIERKAQTPALPLSVCGSLTDPPQPIRDKGQQHLPGDEAWLIGEHRMSGEKKYYLANLPPARLAHLGRHHQKGAVDLRAGPISS